LIDHRLESELFSTLSLHFYAVRSALAHQQNAQHGDDPARMEIGGLSGDKDQRRAHALFSGSGPITVSEMPQRPFRPA
jgi:hypothetical protein